MIAKSAMEDCYEQKKKIQSQTENNKEYWRKIKSYGNRVEKEFHNQRVKTETGPTFGQKIAD